MKIELNLRFLLSLFAVIGITISLGDSLLFFYRFFGSWIKAFSFLFPMALFYLVVYLNASGKRRLPAKPYIVIYMWVFRIFLICILILPSFIDSNFNFIGLSEVPEKWWIELFLSGFKILGIESLVSIMFQWVDA
jgi:hypothetical protein